MISVAIDGPAGAGKSTVAKEVAKKLEFIYVDTGAMYRTLALACIRENIPSEEESKIVEVCKKSKVELKYMNGNQIMFLNGEDVSSQIRTEKVSSMTSIISSYEEVRSVLINLQRELAAKNNVIMDGRDIGTFVLPNADLKIYLTASSKERARRRYNQLKETGTLTSTIEKIEEEIIERDNRDMNRKAAPLKRAEDAKYFDTSDITQEEVVDKLTFMIEEKIKE